MLNIDEKLLRIIGATISNRIKNRIRTNKVTPKTSKGSGTTLVGSSRLLKSITYEVRGDKVFVGTNVKYARIHHEGGLITPRKAQYLAIPLTKAAKVKSPQDFADTSIAKGVISRKLDDGKIEPLYALKKQVKMPARPYMFVDSEDSHIIAKRIKEHLDNQR